MDAFKKETQDVENLFEQITGTPITKFYRPPQGKYNIENLKMAQELGYHTFFWSLAYVDWYQDKQPTREEAFDKLLTRIHPGAIVLLHNTSSTNGQILDELLTKVAEILKNYPEDIVFEEEYEEYDEVAVDQEPFTIEIEDEVYVVRGVGVEKMIGYTNIDTEKGFAFFQRYLKEKGIIEALEEKGIQEGDTVRIYDMEFEFWK